MGRWLIYRRRCHWGIPEQANTSGKKNIFAFLLALPLSRPLLLSPVRFSLPSLLPSLSPSFRTQQRTEDLLQVVFFPPHSIVESDLFGVRDHSIRHKSVVALAPLDRGLGEGGREGRTEGEREDKNILNDEARLRMDNTFVPCRFPISTSYRSPCLPPTFPPTIPPSL